MKHYESVMIEVLRFETKDILTVSVGTTDGPAMDLDFSEIIFL